MEIELRVTEAARAALSCDHQHSSAPQNAHRGTSRPGASADLPPAGQPAIDPDVDLRAAIERVVISRTTIEIELSEGSAGDDQNGILIIPWTPPSLYQRREIIQGEGDQSSAMRLMKTKARAILIEALRDAHRWLDELTTNANQTIEGLVAREGKPADLLRASNVRALPLPRRALSRRDELVPQPVGLQRRRWEGRGRTRGRGLRIARCRAGQQTARSRRLHAAGARRAGRKLRRPWAGRGLAETAARASRWGE